MKRQEVLFPGALFFALLALAAFQEPALGQYGGLAGAASGLAAALLLWYGLKLNSQERSGWREAEVKDIQAERERWNKRLDRLEAAVNGLRDEAARAASDAETRRASQIQSIRELLNQQIQDNGRINSSLERLSGLAEDASAQQAQEADETQKILAQMAQAVQEGIQQSRAGMDRAVQTAKENVEKLEKAQKEHTAAVESSAGKLLKASADTENTLNELARLVEHDVAQPMQDIIEHMDEKIETQTNELSVPFSNVSDLVEEMVGYIKEIKHKVPKIEKILDEMQEDMAQHHDQTRQNAGIMKNSVLEVREELSKLGPAIHKQSETCLEIAGIYREVTSEDRQMLQEILGVQT